MLFALFIPILFGIFTLGTDGARAVQDKARLAEAVEVASLAVAGSGSDDKTLAKAYIQDYFPYAEVDDNDITIRKINCEKNASCQDSEQRFFEYQVSAKIHQPTWFPGSETVVGFGEKYDVASGAISRKYHAETVDVVLVSDFSGSMNRPWTGENGRGEIRYKMMNKIIIEIASELDSFNKHTQGENKNRLAITGFDNFTQQINPANKNQMLHFDHLICGNNQRCDTDCEYYWKRLRCSARSGEDTDDLNAVATVANIFNTSHWSHVQPTLNTKLYPGYQRLSYFQDIELTDDFEILKNKVNSFVIRGSQISGTSSYAGIIRGAQMAKAGTNPRRLIILLSDGADNFTDTTDKLIKAGMCTNIIEHLNSLNVDGEPVKARMTAVGFADSKDIQPQMESCAGEGNVFSAENPDQIKNKILELITEEIGHLAP
nr:Tad domain-containing protein [Salinivibrio socompensis]